MKTLHQVCCWSDGFFTLTTSSGKHVGGSFHFNINNICVGGIRIRHKAAFRIFFPIVVAIYVFIVVSIPVLVYRNCLVEDLNNKRWSLSSVSAGSERPDEQVLGSQEEGREGQREKEVMGL